MPAGPASRSAMEIELNKLSTPRIFLVRMLVFLVACGLVAVVLYKQIQLAFFANPGLNALIGLVLAIGILLSFRQVIRLYPEVSWVNNFRVADPGLADRAPPDPAGADGRHSRRRAHRAHEHLAADHAAPARTRSQRASTKPATFPAT